MRSLIDQLGATPGGVAASLYAMGVRGMPDAPVDPVGTYLHAVISADPDVESLVAGPAGVVVRRRGRGVEVPYPQAVQRFLAAFAAGWYPELHRGSWRTPSTP